MRRRNGGAAILGLRVPTLEEEEGEGGVSERNAEVCQKS